MPKFRLIYQIDATIVGETVEVASKEEALAAAEILAPEVPMLCNQCAREVQLGDIIKAMVEPEEE